MTWVDVALRVLLVVFGLLWLVVLVATVTEGPSTGGKR